MKHSLEFGKPLGLFAPHDLLSDAFSDVRTIFIYRQKNFLNWSCNNQSIEIASNGWESRWGARLNPIIEKLRGSEPIFARHFQNLTDLERIYREISLSVLSLSDDLKKNEISGMIFPTMSSHHVDSLMMEIACQLNGIPQVFQYIPVIKNRCLPIVQYNSVADRRVLSIDQPRRENSDFRTFDSGQVWKAPIIGSSLPRSSKFYRSFLTLMIYEIRTLFRRFRCFTWSVLSGTLSPNSRLLSLHDFNLGASKSSLKKITLWQDLRLMRVHHSSLVLLDEFIASDAEKVNHLLQNKTSSPTESVIAIAANFQPEATSFPEAGRIYNYIDLVVSMRIQGIRGPILFKEHPATRYLTVGNRSTRCGVSRSRSFYSSLRELGVLFLNSDFDLSSSTTVVPLTFNGSLAIERSLKGLPTIVTGHPWFTGLPGTCSLEGFLRNSHKYIRTNKSSTAASAKEFIELLMVGSINIDPILHGSHSSTQDQELDFLEEYRNFLVSIQKNL